MFVWVAFELYASSRRRIDTSAQSIFMLTYFKKSNSNIRKYTIRLLRSLTSILKDRSKSKFGMGYREINC